MKLITKPYHDTIGVYQVINMLTLGIMSQSACLKVSNKLQDTWIGSTLAWIEIKRIKRRIRIRIDKHDTYSMDTTLAYVIVPMLIQLRDSARCSALVELADIPIAHRPLVLETDTDQIHDNWRHVLNEMIWGFTQLQDPCEGESQFYSYKPHDSSDIRMLESVMKSLTVDHEGRDAYNNRIQNALMLFAKYYRNLWN